MLPKANLYYGLENELKKYEIIISDETIIEKNFGIELIDGKIYAQDIESLSFKKLDFDFKIYRNTLDIKSISPTGAFKSMMPDILYLTLNHSIFNPTIIHLKSMSSEWSVHGYIDIDNRTLKVVLVPKKSFKKRDFINMMKKNKNGNYEYDQKF
jgi:hypothetical protein